MTASGLAHRIANHLLSVYPTGEIERVVSQLAPVKPIVEWSDSLLLDGRPFTLSGHEYQRDMLTEDVPRQVFLKGAQVGVTSIVMLKTLHGLISGRYPQGALYLFPTRQDVQDFSRGRFGPLLSDNPDVARFV